MSAVRRPVMVAVLAAAVIALVASAAVAFAVATGPSSGASAIGGGAPAGGNGLPSGNSRAAPNLPGTVVNVGLTNMGGPMMGRRSAMMFGGGMRLSADHTTVPQGTVSFLVSNAGSINHEMVILPLAGIEGAQTRPVGDDGKIDEAGSLGEASKTGGVGAGEGIEPGAFSWVTVTLAPGRYELVCNIAGHYTAGMSTQLTVT